MKIIKLTYRENEGKINHWELNDATFSVINLVVGKNSTGKSRLVSIIKALSNTLTGKAEAYSTGTFDLTLDLDGDKYEYALSFKDTAVEYEKLTVNNEIKLQRSSDGSGSIYYQKLDQTIDFTTPKNKLIAANRLDAEQHPYLIKLNEWAQSVALYNFGSDLGHKNLLGNLDISNTKKVAENIKIGDEVHLISVYAAGFEKYGSSFDENIIKDMGKMGYEIIDVGACNVQDIMPFPFAAFTIFVTENELGFKIPQAQLSQGMYRALALAIHLNFCAMSKEKKLILVDDIGEGLDFERATSIVDLLIEKAQNNEFQLIMTSNDRFVMNKVPLQYWSIMKRHAGTVHIYNQTNSKEKFDEFKYVGLNNFDFFASDFLQNPPTQIKINDFDYNID